MIQHLFSLPVYHTNVEDSEIDFESIKEVLAKEFDSVNVNVQLEKNGGISTYSTNNKLHNLKEFQQLNDLVLHHVKLYWKILDINSGLYPEIDECWSNRHLEGSYTDVHSHAMHPIVVSFYLEAPEDSGNIVFINPMEYAITHTPYNLPVQNKIETSVYVRSKDMVLFPGWLRHKTETSKTNKQRIVITYNIRYTGTYLDSQVPYPVIEQPKYPNPEKFQEPGYVDSVSIQSNNSSMDYLFNKLYYQELMITQLTNLLTNGDSNGK